MNLPKSRNLKNMPCAGPPLPIRPQRNNYQDDQTCSENELESESDDGDTYEAPPTERPLRAIATIKPMSNNDYIERPVSVKPPASLPKPGPKPPADLLKVQNIKPDSVSANMCELYIDPNAAKGSLMNKVFQDAPSIPPPPSRWNSQLSIPETDIGDCDYLELEPTERRGSKSLPDPRPQLPIPPRGANFPTLVAKPPVPIAKPLPPKPLLSSEDSSAGRRTSVSQTKLGVLVPTPFIQSAFFPRMQETPLGYTSSWLISSPSIIAENTNLPSKSWYARKCDRKTAEAVLRENGRDAAFLVRPSSAGGRNQPYTLVVLYRRKVYNIPIRFIESNNQYALGKEKAGEMYFNSVPETIDYYRQNSLILIDQQNNKKESTLLLYPVRL